MVAMDEAGEAASRGEIVFTQILSLLKSHARVVSLNGVGLYGVGPYGVGPGTPGEVGFGRGITRVESPMGPTPQDMT